MTRPIRLLVVSNFFDSHRGGLEIVAGWLARELAGLGWEVAWLATDVTAPPDPASGVRPITIQAWNLTEQRLGVPYPLLGPRGLARLDRAVEAADAVLLHDSLYMTSIATFAATRRRAKPLLVLQHIGAVPYRNPLLRGLMSFANRLIARPILARAEQVVFISETVAGFFRDVGFRAPPAVIFNGVDAGLFRPARRGEKATARRRFGLSPDRPTALFVGRFVEKKGLHWLHHAARTRPDIDWVFAGWGVIDPRAWGLANVRVIDGATPADVAELYRGCDIVVLPSRGEGFPLVVQEALACGAPVVCGAESARADPAATPFLTGVELDPSVSEAGLEVLTAAIDRTLAAETKEAAHRRAEFARGRYAWTAAARAYAERLEQLAGSRAAERGLRAA